MRPEAFREKVAIVTGASAGIGKALAVQLAGEGAKVAIAARRADRLEQVAEECRQRGGEALVVPTDVSEEGQCKELVEKCIEKFGRLDLLINNAGLAVSALFDEFPDLNLFQHTMDINFYGAVYCTYHALPALKQNTGRIVAISSVAGKAALPYNTPYCASKFALHGFYDALRMELRPSGVSVSIICPYWVVTEFHEAQLNKYGKARGKVGRSIYTDKMMTAERCAEISLRAAYHRRREVLMGPGPLTAWLKILAPGFLDWFSVKMFLEPLIKRARKKLREDKA
jgi:short-subunit dehydrogenase